MWNRILNEEDIIKFKEITNNLHDSCIKEIKYVSGAYVNENLGMHATNSKRNLCIYIQRQYKTLSTIELLFEGVKRMNLVPRDEKFDCVIYDSSLEKHQNLFYWSDYEDLDVQNIDEDEGTMVVSENMYWRHIREGLGSKDAYTNRYENK